MTVAVTATVTVTATGMRAACVALERIKAQGSASEDLRHVLCIFNEGKNEKGINDIQREEKERESKEGEIE